MRNAAELRRDADATGWWNGPHLQYVGDGFTVPWETALAADLPLGYTFWIYKQYLDARWLEASRLHDWLYTPYGKLIDVTRLEADSALREEIAVDSIIDAEIVYRAVRFGGAPYFGTSQTGYVGYPLDPSTPNIALAPATLTGSPAVAIKVVIIFELTSTPGASAPSIGYASPQRVGGWTESLWGGLADVATLIGRLRGPRDDGFQPLLPARATLLPTMGTIRGVRLYQGGAGRGQFVPMGFPGAAGTSDIPQMALLCAALNPNTPTVRRFTIRGIPDSQISGGEFDPSNTFASQVKQYFDSMTNFSYNGANVVTKYTVFSITNAGLVTLTVNNPFAIGNIVTFTNVVDANGKRNGGQFIVTAVGPLQSQFTIQAWPFGDSINGLASIPSSGRFNFGGAAQTSVERAVTRKVGRPFDQYRGRRSKRRKKV